MTTEEFEKIVKDWLATAKHPKTKRAYTEMVYQPMLELLAYLRANGFKTFIVSGGGIEFMRALAEQVYGIPPEQVVGSSGKTKFEMRDGKPVLVKLPEVNFVDDKDGKPIGIQTAHRPPSDRRVRQFRRRPADAAMDRRRRRRALLPLRPPHRRRARVGLRPRVAHRTARQGPRRSEGPRLDRREHEGRLGARVPFRVRGRRSTILIALGGLVGVGLLVWTIVRPPAKTEPSADPSKATTAGYVRNDRCVDCHQAQATAWASSHHAHAMAPASPTSVRGSFDDAELRHDGITSRFFRRDGKFVVHTDGPAGTPADFEVKFTFGVDPLQQYLVELDPGHVQALTIAWDTERRRWFDLLPDETPPLGDVLHWTGRYQSWNGMCASCHSTNVRKAYDAAADRYATTWSEINVSCQSCHGPGERHVAWAQNAASGDRGLVVDFRAGSEREIETCAPCHARRSELTAAPVPGNALYDDFLPALLTPDLYHADGQQLGEVYEYGSFRQSKMYQAGVRCTDCHDPHTATLRSDGDALCVRCHQTSPDTARFPGLPAKTYDSPAHHHHQASVACVDCHMPARNYMIVHARRDHAIRVPRPDLTVKLGTPNACASCHADREPQWAADAIARWYPARPQDTHYGEILAAGRAGGPDAEAALAKLVAAPSEPGIVRATAANLLGRYGASSVGVSVAATRDPDPAVRTAAAGSLLRVPAEGRSPLVAPLLSDPVRAVRIEAARVLASVPADRVDASLRRAFDAATAELVAAQQVSLDMPGSHLNLAVLHESRGDGAAAEGAYRHALRLDPDFTPARLNLSRLLNGLGRNADAERVLADGLARVPAQGELAYSLGLLLAEEQRLAEAAEMLGRAADLLPGRARARYNHALALQQLGRRDDAERAFVQAHAIDPADPGIVYALTVLYVQGGAWPKALASAERLAAMAPDDPQVQAFVADVRRRGR